jgi:hypothetical protein
MKVRDSDLARVRGQRKMSQVLGAFGLLDLPCYGPFSLGARFETYEPFISLVFPIFFSDRGKPRILSKWIRGHDCTTLLKVFVNCLAPRKPFTHRQAVTS